MVEELGSTLGFCDGDQKVGGSLEVRGFDFHVNATVFANPTGFRGVIVDHLEVGTVGAFTVEGVLQDVRGFAEVFRIRSVEPPGGGAGH